jgi:hypothetical protein
MRRLSADCVSNDPTSILIWNIGLCRYEELYQFEIEEGTDHVIILHIRPSLEKINCFSLEFFFLIVFHGQQALFMPCWPGRENEISQK